MDGFDDSILLLAGALVQVCATIDLQHITTQIRSMRANTLGEVSMTWHA